MEEAVARKWDITWEKVLDLPASKMGSDLGNDIRYRDYNEHGYHLNLEFNEMMKQQQFAFLTL